MADDRIIGSDAAAAVRAKRGTPTAKAATATGKPQAVLGTTTSLDEQDTPARALDTMAASPGVTSDAPSPAHTLTGSFVAGHIDSADYTYAAHDGHYSWYPPGCKQPSTRLLWNRGQRVLQSYYDSYGGDNAPATPQASLPVNREGGGVVMASNGPGVPGHTVVDGHGVVRVPLP